jgi:3-oxoacyl-[acyl-carrier protein] reductase
VSDLQGRCAIVTGGGRGIGRAICLKLAGRGADIAVVDILETDAAETARQVGEVGRKSVSITCDVSRSDDVARMFEGVIAELGGVHILVNNAGITRDDLLVRMSDDEWNSVIGVNLTGVFNCCRAASKVLMKQRFGRIVNVSSVVGIMGNPGQANYCASKAGIIGLTKSIARELATRGVTANAIAPGFIETDMTKALPEKARETLLSMVPLGRAGTVDDVANVVAFLVSDDADYITGQVISIAGGMIM